MVLIYLRSMKESIQELHKVCQPSSWCIMGSIFENLSLYITRFFINTKITPNQITVMWIFFHIIGSLFLTTGNYVYMLVGVVLYHIAYLLDCVDGQLARYKKQFSLLGVHIDYMGHVASFLMFFVCLTIGVYVIYKQIIYVIIGVIVIIFYIFGKLFSINIASFKRNQWNKLGDLLSGVNFKKSDNKIKIFLFELFRIEGPLNIIFWGILFGLPQYVLMVYGVIFFAEFFRKVVSQIIGLKKLDKIKRNN